MNIEKNKQGLFSINFKETLHHLWDKVVMYLPLVVMAVLAVGSYSLVRNSPIVSEENAKKEAKHEPDAFISKFSVKTFTEIGQIKTQLFGSVGVHYPDTDTIEMSLVRLHNFDLKGRLSTVVSSQKGISNGDQSEIQLVNQARLIRETVVNEKGFVQPRMELSSKFFHAYIDDQILKTNQPVVATRGIDRFTANAMTYEHLTRQLELQGNVRATLYPTKQSKAAVNTQTSNNSYAQLRSQIDKEQAQTPQARTILTFPNNTVKKSQNVNAKEHANVTKK